MKTLHDVNLKDKTVLIRVDFNVPMKNGVITSDKRIIEAIPTIKYVVDQGAKVILLSHLGRIKTEEDKPAKSLHPVAQDLSNKLNKTVMFCKQPSGDAVKYAVSKLQPGDILMLENTRYEDLNEKAESKNAEWLGKFWASLGDVFVNDAFGTAHRAHASNVGITNNIKEACVGFLVEKELKALNKAIENPARPSVAILGGAKVSDKIKVIEKLAAIYDKVLIGGGMRYTFDKALGHNVGQSLIEEDQIQTAKMLLQKFGNKLILPVDVACAKEFKDVTPVYFDKDIPDDYMGLDIGPKSIELFKRELQGAKTVVWNGPLGVFEFENFKTGTLEIAKTIAQLPDCYSVVGGGDSASAVINLGLEKGFSHISTGGGASLCLLEGSLLPAIEAIKNK